MPRRKKQGSRNYHLNGNVNRFGADVVESKDMVRVQDVHQSVQHKVEKHAGSSVDWMGGTGPESPGTELIGTDTAVAYESRSGAGGTKARRRASKGGAAPVGKRAVEKKMSLGSDAVSLEMVDGEDEWKRYSDSDEEEQSSRRDDTYQKNRKQHSSEVELFGFNFGAVGRFVEDIATTLDTVIGQALDEWTSPAPSIRVAGLSKEGTDVFEREENGNVSDLDTDQDNKDSDKARDDGIQQMPFWSEFDLEQHEDGFNTRIHLQSNEVYENVAHVSSKVSSSSETKNASPWRKRAMILQKELYKLRLKCAEQEFLSKDNEELKQHLVQAKSAIDNLGEENSQLRHMLQNTGQEFEFDDTVEQQTMHQIEILLAEKALLSQENDRLSRENHSLKELVELLHAFDVDEDSCEEDETRDSC